MTDRETLYRGLSHAAWGYFFLHFNFTLSINAASINLLPAFVGMLLLLSAINKLKEERRDLALLRPLGILLEVWYLADWALALFGTTLEGRFLFLDLLILAVTLYFHFQFLTDMAALAEQYQPEGYDLDRRLRWRRNALVVLHTGVMLVSDLAGLITSEWQLDLAKGAVACMAVAMLVVVILLMVSLFQLRRCVRMEENGPETLE